MVSRVAIQCVALFVAIGALSARSAAAHANAATNKLIYGNDDRTDVYAATEEPYVSIARQSVVAMVENDDLNRTEEQILITGYSLISKYGICDDERFAKDLSFAACSGTLIADDLVLTAGHCVPDQDRCDAVSFVFGAYNIDAGVLKRITEDEVFACKKVLVSELSTDGGVSVDFGLIQLDRPATPEHVPVPVRTESSILPMRTPVTVIGFGMGLAMKIDSGGIVQKTRPEELDYFNANLDTFGGNSGSGVFTSDGLVVGILVAGRPDFTYDDENRCRRYGRERDTVAFERSTYAFRAIDALCNSTARNDYALCAHRCGNGECEFGETVQSCPEDCSTVNRCGNGTCEPDEYIWSCPVDCRLVVPPEWTCEDSLYGNRDGCHCGCGIVDADCGEPDQPLFGCEEFRGADRCSIAGECGSATSLCGNNRCDLGETATSCPIDCDRPSNGDARGSGCATTRRPSGGGWLFGALALSWISLRRRRRATGAGPRRH